jgi:hypothetical protein
MIAPQHQGIVAIALPKNLALLKFPYSLPRQRGEYTGRQNGNRHLLDRIRRTRRTERGGDVAA